MVYAKAFTSAAIAALAVAYTALNDSSVSAQEWVEIASATIAAFAGVWVVPNRTNV